MQSQEGIDGKGADLKQDHEQTLYAKLRDAEEKQQSRYYRAARHFSQWKNVVDLLTLVGVVLTIAISLALWHAQIGANGINARIYEATTRPWLMLSEIKPVSLTSDDEAGVLLWATVNVKNVGHSPAQNVSVSGALLISNFDPPMDQAMESVCQQARAHAPAPSGRVVFPDQGQLIDGETPTSFDIDASKVWAARAERIRPAQSAQSTPADDKAWHDAVAKFPFYADLNLVGCVNYWSADNAVLYQTSFMFGLGAFPLLSDLPPDHPAPIYGTGNADTVLAQPRKLQRIIPGDQIKLGTPLYGTFAR